jgi:predicted TPR repeat methyltransferase
MADDEHPEQSAELTLEQALDLAVKLHDQGRLEQAIALYAQILEAAPQHGPTLLLAGACRLQQGDPEQALSLMDAALAAGYETVELLHNRALAFKALGRPEEALPELLYALKLEPGRESTLFNLANTLRELNRTHEAAGRYHELLERNPEHAPALVNLSAMLEDQGDAQGAEDAARRAAATGSAMGHLRLGQVLERAGRTAEAEQAFARCLELDPEDSLGAGLHLARLRGEKPDKAPDGFVQGLYDRYAGRFDEHLDSLDYRGPELLRQALDGRPPPARDLDALDLGCGTGLCGPVLRPLASTLIGADLSREMLARAERTGAYDRLEQAEAADFLRSHPQAFDLVAAMDVLLYAGDLAPALQAAAASLRAGGLFVFTVEQASRRGFELTGDMRYAHSEDHVREGAQRAGLAVETAEPVQLRQDEGRPVAGLLFVLSKPAG